MKTTRKNATATTATTTRPVTTEGGKRSHFDEVLDKVKYVGVGNGIVQVLGLEVFYKFFCADKHKGSSLKIVNIILPRGFFCVNQVFSWMSSSSEMMVLLRRKPSGVSCQRPS